MDPKRDATEASVKTYRYATLDKDTKEPPPLPQRNTGQGNDTENVNCEEQNPMENPSLKASDKTGQNGGMESPLTPTSGTESYIASVDLEGYEIPDPLSNSLENEI